MRQVSVEQRRARLRRHKIIPGDRGADVADVTAAMVCLHATDPATVFLSALARTDDFGVDDLEQALYRDRTLIKHLAMRRTLFVFDRKLLPAAQAGASTRVAAAETRRLIKDVEKAGLHTDGESWLGRAKQAAVEGLADGREATSTELREEHPVLQGGVMYGAGKSWGGEVPVGPRVLTILSAEGRIVRASNRGDWATSRPRWTAMESWLGEPLDPPTVEDGHRELVQAWLRAFGPGTVADIKWWLGSTLAATRASLAELGAVEVDLGGSTGYLLPDDLEPDPQPEPWVALLPGLDPTTMGWYDRGWYLDHDHRKLLFDTAGNAGPTVWCDGRIVGGWWQDPDGQVVVHLLAEVGADAEAALRAEADRLTDWLDGRVVMLRFPSPLAKAVTGR